MDQMRFPKGPRVYLLKETLKGFQRLLLVNLGGLEILALYTCSQHYHTLTTVTVTTGKKLVFTHFSNIPFSPQTYKLFSDKQKHL